ncbi:MAG: hypothetical protein SGCHY_004466 [Lobulomycetales sp.]
MKEDGDWEGFVSAFKALNDKGILANFVQMHSPSQYWFYAHGTPFFLLWHRLFIKEFERALQAEGAAYIPYV